MIFKPRRLEDFEEIKRKNCKRPKLKSTNGQFITIENELQLNNKGKIEGLASFFFFFNVIVRMNGESLS